MPFRLLVPRFGLARGADGRLVWGFVQWPQPPTASATAASVVYDEWVRVDESVTKVQLAMRVARVFNGFVEVRVAPSFLRRVYGLCPDVVSESSNRKQATCPCRESSLRLSSGGCVPTRCIGLGLSG